MNSKSDSQNSPSSPPWEDALIIALRDLQWLKKNQGIGQIFNSELRASLGSEVVLKRIESISTPPPLLAKFDGNAESASGDVLTSSGKRFFLFELKASESLLSSETGKFVFNCLASVNPEYSEDQLFLKLSRRGHHALYPVVAPSHGKIPAGFLPVHQVALTTKPYYDAVVERVSTTESVSASDLLWHKQELGLQVHEMAAYLWALAKVHEGDSTRHPLKVVVTASGDGSFFWPCADITQFIEFAAYFDKTLLNNASTELYQSLQSRFSGMVPRLRAAMEASNASIAEANQDNSGSTPSPF